MCSESSMGAILLGNYDLLHSIFGLALASPIVDFTNGRFFLDVGCSLVRENLMYYGGGAERGWLSRCS